MIPSSALANTKGFRPRSSSRATVAVAEFVCSVENTW